MTRQTARKAIGIVSMAAGVLMIAAAIFLLFWNNREDEQAGKSSEEVLPVLEELIDQAGDGGTEAGDTEDDSIFGEVAGMKTALIDGYEYIGYLVIPALGLELPVMSEWDYTRLRTAPCRYAGSAVTDDLVICGHNYRRHFGSLKKLRSGDTVIFTDMGGTSTAYTVKGLETLQPTQVDEMITGDFDLTLYTCTYGGQSRVTVRCDRAG